MRKGKKLRPRFDHAKVRRGSSDLKIEENHEFSMSEAENYGRATKKKGTNETTGFGINC